MAKKKQKCPYCGKYFVYLNRHVCKMAPGADETLTNGSKKKTSSKKTTAKKSVAKKSTKKTSSSKTKKSTKKSTSAKGKKTTTTKSKSAIVTKKSSASSKASSKPQSSRKIVAKPRPGSTKKSTKRRSYSEIDKALYKLVKDANEIFVQDVMEKLDLDEKTLNKSVNRLTAKQKITIKSDVREGFRTHKLYMVKEYELTDKTGLIAKNEEVVWETLGDCPCFLCPEIDKCNTGQNDTNPIYCDYLVDWINCSLKDEPYDNPFKAKEEEDDKKKKK